MLPEAGIKNLEELLIPGNKIYKMKRKYRTDPRKEILIFIAPYFWALVLICAVIGAVVKLVQWLF
jgi:hypothetical protein